MRFPIKMRLKKTLEEHLKENPESGHKPRKIVERLKIIQERPFKAMLRDDANFKKKFGKIRAGSTTPARRIKE